ncbi:MAG: ABC transporter permease [Bdellovibrionales bacterium]|nr:ABC transporter permease [Bdellovibrionales bacterium]
MTAVWLAVRYFGNWRQFFNLSTGLSILGMCIGVASLVVSMAVFSGYATTLEKTVQDAVGHLIILKRGSADQSEMLKDLQPLLTGKVAETPFVYAEAIVAHKGKINGILIEGVDLSSVNKVLNLQNRLIAGDMDLQVPAGEIPKALIGKGIAEKFGLKVGDEFRVVVPLSTEFHSASFRPKLGKYRVGGIVNYGRYDFDSRYVVMPMAELQAFVEIGERITGYRVRLQDPHKAAAVAAAINSKQGPGYWARDWVDVNRNLFEAARLEKTVLFFVLMILIVAAAFNIANTLFINVVQRYRDISVLKTLGATDTLIRRIFTAQGLIVGLVGAGLGIAVGLGLCNVVEWAIVRWHIIPADVYKLDNIELEVRGLDLALIVAVSMVVCFVATLVPSRRGAKISPVEGLRYE